jgi:hypothetical protein
MPQLLYAKKLQAAHVHPEVIPKCCYMPQLLYAEKLQEACMQLLCMYSHKPENASCRDAKRRRTNETRHEGPEGALIFLCATIEVRKRKRRKQVLQRGTILVLLYVESCAQPL